MPSNWLKVTSRWSFSVRKWYPLELWVLAKAGAARVRASAPEATAARPMWRKEIFIIVSRSGGHHGFSGEAARLVPHPRQDHQRARGESLYPPARRRPRSATRRPAAAGARRSRAR